MCIYKVSFVLTGFLSFLYSSFADADTRDLDDIKLYDIVKVEQCLDQAYDTIPGHARKLEFKVEGDDPIYEFDIESSNDGSTYNVECNAEEGYIIEVEKEVDENNPTFKNGAKISIEQARINALEIHPGRIVNEDFSVKVLTAVKPKVPVYVLSTLAELNSSKALELNFLLDFETELTLLF